MNHIARLIIVLGLIAMTQLSLAAPAASVNPRVRMETSVGVIILELDRTKAPATVANFLRYVHEGFYDGTVFHRVIKHFMIQGGGYETSFHKKTTHEPIRNEADNGLTNLRGTIAMARTGDPHSATAQFFINTVDNRFLNYSAPTRRGWGYAVFGKVLQGMAVADQIEQLPTGQAGPFPRDVPHPLVVIQRVTLLPAAAPAPGNKANPD